MKLNNFFDKSNNLNRKQTKIISVINEKKENEFKSEISRLQIEINRLEQVEIERSLFNQRMQSAETRLEETLEREVSLKAQNDLLEYEVEQGNVLREEKQFLQNELRDAKGQIGIQESILEQAQHNSVELNRNVEKLTYEYDLLKTEESSLKLQVEDQIQKAAANKHTLQELNTKFSEVTESIYSIQFKYSELLEEHEKVGMLAAYWKNVSDATKKENDDLAETSGMLKQLKESVKEERIQQKGLKKLKSNELVETQNKLKNMVEAVEYLTEKNQYFSTLVSALRKEVAKPRYASMGSIVKREGFKMPLGNENIRKQFLGTSAPTLLKFKAKEDEDDN